MAKRHRTRTTLDETLQKTLDAYYKQQSDYMKAHPYNSPDTKGVELKKVLLAAESLRQRTAKSVSTDDPMMKFLNSFADEVEEDQEMAGITSRSAAVDLPDDEEPVEDLQDAFPGLKMPDKPH